MSGNGQTVSLTGIKAGPSNEGQALTVTATSSNRWTDPGSGGRLHEPGQHRFFDLYAGCGSDWHRSCHGDGEGQWRGGQRWHGQRGADVHRDGHPVTVQPQLRIDRGSGGNLIVAWPTNVTGCMLQSRPNVEVSWNTVSAAPVVRNGEYQVTVSAVGGASFYRLAPYVWQPALTIRPGNGVVTISWPTTGNYHLQSRSNLGNGTWANVAATPSVVDGENVLVVNTSGLANFYRLSNSAP